MLSHLVWLILDIGNSAVKGGLFENGLLTRTFRMESRPTASIPSYRHALRRHCEGFGLDRVGIVSVVPELTHILSEAVRFEFPVWPERIGITMRLPFEMGYRTPETLGADRLAAAVAGFRLHGLDDKGKPRSVIVVDAGTAVTFDVIDARRVYRGGAITAGPALVLNALARGTAQLPEVSAHMPPRAIGRSTREALQSGVLFGFVDSVESMVARMARQVRGRPFVVVTGGWGELLSEVVPAVDRFDRDLVLYGGHHLLEMNPRPGEVLA